MNLKISSVLSIDDVEDRDLAILALLGESPSKELLDQLEELLEHVAGSYERTEAYIVMYMNYKDLDPKRAIGHLNNAAKAAIAAEEYWQRAELLSKIGKIYVSEGLMDLAKASWDRGANIAAEGEKSGGPQDSLDCASVLGEIATNFVGVGMKDEAIRIAKRIRNLAMRERTLTTI